MSATQARKRSRPIPYDDIEDCNEIYDTRPPSSTRRYRSTLPHQADTLDDLPSSSGKSIQRRSSLRTQRISGSAATSTLRLPKTDALRPRLSFSWMTLLVGMVLMAGLMMLLSTAFSWWQVYQDDIHFGRPRTYQFDDVVGHNDSTANQTHFIIMNLHRRIQIIEFPGGDSTHARIFFGPTLLGAGQDLTPVTGEIRDINGKKDLVLHIQNQQIVFLNDGTNFHPQ